MTDLEHPSPSAPIESDGVMDFSIIVSILKNNNRENVLIEGHPPPSPSRPSLSLCRGGDGYPLIHHFAITSPSLYIIIVNDKLEKESL